MITTFLNSLVKSTIATFLRFPFSLLSALLGTSLFIYLHEQDYNSQSPIYLPAIKLIVTCSLALTLFFSLRLVGERRIIPLKQIFVDLVGLALLALYYCSLPDKPEFIANVRYCLFTISLHLLCSFAPFIRHNEPNGFWQYNKALFIGILTALLYSFVLYVGLSVALLGVHKLFDCKIPEEVYLYLYYVIVGVFNTWFFLSQVPTDFKALQASDEYPNGLKIFTQYVLLPLVTLYLLILYGYELKILAAFALPKGWVSYLVIAFSILGILSLLLIHPIREREGNKWIQAFSQRFYIALFPLLVLFFVAISTRVFAYGMTELRYFIMVLALWLGGIACYFLMRKNASIKVIPVSLCLIGFAASFGPWGAFYVAKKSQLLRFAHILERNNLLKDNTIAKGPKSLPLDDVAELSAVLDYLEDRKALNEVAFYFGSKADSILNDPDPTHSAYNPSVLMELVGLTYSTTRSTAIPIKYFNFEASDKTIALVKGFDYQLKYTWNSYQVTQPHFRIGQHDFTAVLEEHTGKLSLKEAHSDTLQFQLMTLWEDSLHTKGWQTSFTFPSERLAIQNENGAYLAKVIVHSAQIETGGINTGITDLEADILIKCK